jgi:hypothetical protein
MIGAVFDIFVFADPYHSIEQDAGFRVFRHE